MQTKFFNSNALCGVFCALFAGFVFVIASCGGGGSTGPSEGDSSSSSAPPPMSAVYSPNVLVNTFSAAWFGPQQSHVAINVSLTLTEYDSEKYQGFDSVIVKVDGKVVNADDKGNNQHIFQFNKQGSSGIEITDIALCSRPFFVSYEAYAFGEKTAISTPTPISMTKDGTGMCRSSSSIVPSSSSIAAAKSLIPITFDAASCDSDGTTCLITSNRGVNLSEARGTTVTTSGDLYIDWAPRDLRTVGGATINDQFARLANPDNCGNRGRAFVLDNPTVAANPTTESFVHRSPPCTIFKENIIDFAEQRFYVVRTGATVDAEDWTAGWFLIQTGNEDLPKGGTYIKAWKVN